MIPNADIRLIGTGIDRLKLTRGLAELSGRGWVHGRGSYAYSITATDGGATARDRIRVKIWNARGVLLDTGSGDNSSTAGLRLHHGRIVIR
jgi:hypothetical protein